MSPDRLFTRPIIGPDRGGDPRDYAGKAAAPVAVNHFSTSYRVRSGVAGPDRGGNPDEFLPKAKPVSVTVSTELPKEHTAVNVKTKTLLERRAPKSRANGAELILDPQGTDGRAIAYINADSPRPFLTSIRGLKIRIDRRTSIGQDGQRENRVIFDGPNRLVALGLTQLEIEETTITVRSRIEINQLPEPKDRSQEAAA
jgi:hypothetical protein